MNDKLNNLQLDDNILDTITGGINSSITGDNSEDTITIKPAYDNSPVNGNDSIHINGQNNTIIKGSEGNDFIYVRSDNGVNRIGE